MRLTFEQPKSVNEGENVEKPKDKRAPVQRLVMRRLGLHWNLCRVVVASIVREGTREPCTDSTAGLLGSCWRDRRAEQQRSSYRHGMNHH